MLRIRLARGGAKKRPYYFIVVADSHSPRDGRFIERVGTYNPLLKKDDPNRITLKTEQIQGWLKKGAQPTDRVARFLSAQGLVSWKHGDNPNKGKPHAKAEERATERSERAAAAAAAPPPPPPAEEPAVVEGAEEAAPAEEVALQADQAAEAAAEEPAAEAAAEEAAPAEEPAVTEAAAEDAAPAEEAPLQADQAEEAAPEEAPAEPEAPAEGGEEG